MAGAATVDCRFIAAPINIATSLDQSHSILNDHLQSILHERDTLTKGLILVVDIGKTHSKLTLWSAAGELRDRQVRANEACEETGIHRLDVDGIGGWLLEVLSGYRGLPIEAIVPVGHGAGVAALRHGALAFAPLDYEQAPPDEVLAAYRQERDRFALTGSPALPAGLNLGAQLYWLERLYPEAMREAVLVPWAQYWAWFLTGHAVSEVTSLGCHSDLWLPREGCFSPLAERLGWAARFAPLARAHDVVGTLRPELAAATCLPPRTRVLAGLHDSNAALLTARSFDEFAGRDATLLSTGTWFVAMRTPDERAPAIVLPEARDCLVNVDVQGRAVPSARFMGGREIELATGGDGIDAPGDQPAQLAAISGLLATEATLLPTLTLGCGPFPDATGGWIAEPRDRHARQAAVCLYAALVADASLDLIGAGGALLVEGRFAGAEVFVRALAALRPETRAFTTPARNDLSFGALRLIDPSLQPAGRPVPVVPLAADLTRYRAAWRAASRLQGPEHAPS